MTPPAQQVVLRLALVAMAVDSRSALTVAQRTWIARVSRERRALTAEECLRLRAPLTAWVKQEMPQCLEIIERQFEEDREDVASRGIRLTAADTIPLSPVWRGGLAPHVEP